MTKRLKGQAGKIDEFIGKRLLQFRHLSGFSQETLANATGMTFQQIQKYEKGTNRIAAPRLYDFSKILGVSVNDFFDGYEAQPKNKVGQLIDRIPPDLAQVLTSFNGINDKSDRAAAAKNMALIVKIFKEKQDV